MRAAVQLFRPMLRLSHIWKTPFSNITHTQRIQDIRAKFKLHEQKVKEAKQFVGLFTNEYLLTLVEQNYCFSDLVDICNALVHHKDGPKSDQEILFLAYAYNLYYSELKRGKKIINSINDALQSKIDANHFIFESAIIEKHFLSNIKSLTNRYNNYLSEDVATLKATLFNFLMRKYQVAEEVEAGTFKQINEKALGQFLAAMPYFPKESTGQKKDQLKLEKYYIFVLCYELKQFLDKPDAEVNREFIRETIARFISLMQIGVMLGNLNGNYFNIFVALPKNFSSEAKFANYLRVIKEYFTFQMLAWLDFEKFDIYNQQLAENNLAYRSAETVQVFESYVESLILLKKGNLRVFSAYFGYEQSKRIEPKRSEGEAKYKNKRNDRRRNPEDSKQSSKTPDE